MKHPNVSILVLVYDVSEYIEKCVHSLLNQTFNDIEYVFINDATQDDSMKKIMKVIENYPHRKNDIKIITHTVNKGISFSRKEALDNSLGKYILFVDGDDYVELNTIELLYKKAQEEESDIVVCDLIKEYKNKSDKIIDHVFSNKDENFYNMLVNKISYGYLCNKLIIRDLFQLEDCKIPEDVNYLEDLCVMTRFYYYANKISKVDQVLYHYNLCNQNSITSKKNRMHFENAIQYWNHLDDFLNKKQLYKKYKNTVDWLKLQTKVNLIFDTSDSQLRLNYADIFMEQEKKYFKDLKLVQKIMLFCVHKKYIMFTKLIRSLLVLKNKLLKVNFQNFSINYQ